MTHKALRSGLKTSLMVALVLSVAAVFSVKDEGVQLTTGGVEMMVSADLERGLQISFIAPN